MAIGKEVGKLSIRVLPDTTRFRNDLQLLIKRVENSMSVNITVNAKTRDAEIAIAKFRAVESAKKIDLSVGASTAAARAQLAVLSRNRVVSLIAKVNEASMAKVQSSFMALTGIRLVKNILGDFNKNLSNIDQNLPKIARVATGMAALASAILSSGAGLVTVTGDLVKMGAAGLVLPAMFAGMATGIVTLALALKDSKAQLSELGPAMRDLQDSISSEFWTRAKQPIVDFVTSVLPQLQNGFAVVAGALGNQAKAVADAFKVTFGGGVLEKMFVRLAETMDIVTRGATGFAEAVTTLGTVGSNYLPRFATWVVKISDGFNSWLQDASVSGRLDQYIEEGIAQMKNFARAIDGIIGVLRAIDSAATAAGGGGLKVFADNLQAAAAAMQSPAFQTALTTILEGAAAGLSAMGEGIKTFGGTLGVLAPQIATVLTLAGEAIGGLASAIATALESPIFKKGLVDFFEGIKTGIDALGPAMGPLFEFVGSLGTAIGALAAQVGPLLAILKETFAPILTAVLEAVTPLITAIGVELHDAIESVVPVFQGLGDFLSNNIGGVQAFAIAILSIVAAVKAVQFGTMVGEFAKVTAAMLVNKAETLYLVALYAKDMVVAIAKTVASLAIAAAAWAVNTAALIASKIQTVILVGMYATDMVVALAKTVAGLAVSTGAWIANTAAQIATKVALIAGAVASGIATVAQYALNLAMSLNPIGLIITAIVALVAGLVWFFTQTELGQDIWANFTKFLGEAWNNIVAVGTAVFTALGQFFTDTWNNIVAFITGAVAVIMDIFFNWHPLGIIIANWDAIVQFFVDTWNNIVAFVTDSINNVRIAITTVSLAIALAWTTFWDGVFSTANDIWTNIVTFVNDSINNVRIAITTVALAIALAWTTFWDGVFSTINDIWNNIVTAVSSSIAFVRNVISAVMAVVVSVWNNYWNGVFSTINDIWNNIVSAISAAIAFVQNVISNVMGVVVAVWTGYWDTVGAIVSGAWNSITGFVDMIVGGIQNMIGRIGETLASVPGLVGNAFANAGTWLMDAGASIIQGLIDGINGMIGLAQDAAEGVMNAIANFFPHSPAKEGPFSGRGWTLYSGQAMGDGLAEGMESRVAKIRRTALTMISGAAPSSSSIDLRAVSAAPQAAVTDSGTAVTVMGDVGYNPAEIAAEIDKKKRQAAMLSGLQRLSVA